MIDESQGISVGASLGPSVETDVLHAQAGTGRQGHSHSPEASADG